MIIQCKNVLFRRFTREVMLWEEITKDNRCLVNSQKIIPQRKGLYTVTRVEFCQHKSNNYKKAQTGFYTYLGFFNSLEFLFRT